MSDRLSVLTSVGPLLAKTWRADGTIGDYDDAKYYTLNEVEVSGIGALSALLTRLERAPRSCIIRGRYVGDEVARSRDPADPAKKHDGFKSGKVRRALDYFDDQPLHTLLVDVDKFQPVFSDALTDPAEAIEEFIRTMLPAPFTVAAYHWQLSNSAGHPSKGDELRAHIWFWLDRPLTSAQLTAWALATGFAGDVTLFRTVQVHYTAAPVMEAGQVDPYPVRSGYVPGVMGDAVELDVDPTLLAASSVSGGRGQRLRDAAASDPIAQALYDAGLVRSQGVDGRLNIVCPFAEEHGTGEGGETSTQYFPPHTGGYMVGHFKCLHQTCASRSRGLFLARLGIDETADEFDVVTPEASHQPAAKRDIPDAQHMTTDLANAERLVKKFGRRLIVVAGQWHAWTGMRWEKDEGEVYRFGCMLSKIIHQEADAWMAKEATRSEERERNTKIAEALVKWATRSEMKATIEAAVGLAKKMLAVEEERIDADPWLLNCMNGTVDLRTGALKAHDPADYITKLVPLAFDPTAKAPMWESVLSRVTLEDGMTTTRPLAGFLQRWFGYCATGSTREQVFVVHYGSGSNGKSTILDTVGDVLGDYAATAAPGLVVSVGKDRHPTEIADLMGRRMVTAHETGDGGVLREDFVKQATGGDKLKARFMRADFFEFAPTHKLQLLTNHKPVIKGSDNGIWRRVLLMPYMARFGPPEEVAAGRAHYIKDTRIAERIKAEAQGVLRWIVDGARQWFHDGLQPPDAVLAASRDYQTEQDRVLQFVSECCEVGRDMTVPVGGSGSLYEAYQDWCRDGGIHAMSKNRLVQEVERVVPGARKLVKKSKGDEGRRRSLVVFCGLRLIDGVELGADGFE